MIEKLKKKIAIKYICENGGIMMCNGVGLIGVDKEEVGLNAFLLIKTMLQTNILTKQQINRLIKLASTMPSSEIGNTERKAIKEIVGGE